MSTNIQDKIKILVALAIGFAQEKQRENAWSTEDIEKGDDQEEPTSEDKER